MGSSASELLAPAQQRHACQLAVDCSDQPLWAEVPPSFLTRKAALLRVPLSADPLSSASADSKHFVELKVHDFAWRSSRRLGKDSVSGEFQGANGAVYACKVNKRGFPLPQQEFAVKMALNYEASANSLALRAKFEHEASILRSLPLHPGLTKVLHSFIGPMPRGLSSKTWDDSIVAPSAKSFFVVMELHEPSLETLLRARVKHAKAGSPAFLEIEVAHIGFHVLDALCHLRNHRELLIVVEQLFLAELLLYSLSGVVHLDLKPDNIMFSNFGPLPTSSLPLNLLHTRTVLIDFGCAIGALNAEMTFTFASRLDGAWGYRAPELRRMEIGHEYSYAGADAWSFGLVLAQLMLGSIEPVGDEPAPADRKERAHVEIPALPQVYSEPLRRTVLGLLDSDPAKRLSVFAAREQMSAILAQQTASLCARCFHTVPAHPIAEFKAARADAATRIEVCEEISERLVLKDNAWREFGEFGLATNCASLAL